MDLEQLETEVRIAIEEKHFSLALEKVIGFVQDVVNDPETIGRLFGSRRLDEICCNIASTYLKIHRPLTKSVSAIGKSKVAILTTELGLYGGHTLVIEDLIHADPNREYIVLITDILNRVEIEKIKDRFPTLAEVRIAHKMDMLQKFKWLLEQLGELVPTEVFLFNYNQDAVITTAASIWSTLSKVYFFHHADHHLCLGVHLPNVVHIDLHNIGFYNCQEHEKIACNKYLPLTIRTEISHIKERTFLKEEFLKTCTAGSSVKFLLEYNYHYASLIADRLSIAAGLHYHIGDLPDNLSKEIREELSKRDIDSSRFVHIKWVQSVRSALVEWDIDLYISSFPLGGGRAAIEAMSAGVPILAHDSNMSRFHAGADLIYPEAFVWRLPEEFISAIKSLTPNLLKQHSEFSADYFEEFHNFRILVSELQEVLVGGGSLLPPSMRLKEIDFLKRYFQLQMVRNPAVILGYENKINEKDIRISQLENQVHAILTSQSWKITAPVRAIFNILKRLR